MPLMTSDGKQTKTHAPRRNPSRGVTMETVGKLAGVSQVTVSRALSDPSKVSPKTLAKIQEAIQATGFVPNALAGALASSRSRLISALIPSITNIVYVSMIKAFSEEMRAHGYQILLSETGFDLDDEQRVIETHLSRRPDAVLLTGIHHSAHARHMLLGAGIPVVELWDITDSPVDTCVGFSHTDAGRLAGTFARDKGYTIAGTVTASDERAMRRKDAFIHTFSASEKNRVIVADVGGPASIQNGRIGLSNLLEQGFKGGVIFCSSDALAEGVIIEANIRGMRVPEDLALIGFGDQEFAVHLEPALTTIKVDRERMGREAAQALVSRLDGPMQQGSHIIDIGFELIERSST